MRGCGDPVIFGNWLRFIMTLWETAKKMKTEELYADIGSLNTTSAYGVFTEKVFGVELAQCLHSPLSSAFLSRGVSLAKEIMHGNNLLKTTTFSNTSGLAKFFDLRSRQNKQDVLATKARRKSASVV